MLRAQSLNVSSVVGALAVMVGACSDGSIEGGSATGGTGMAGAGVAMGGSSAGTSGGAGVGNSSGPGGSGGTSAGSGGTSAGSGGTGDCTPEPGCMLDAPPSTGDIHQDCVDRIHQFRGECLCLPPLARWTDGEACAYEQAEYDSTRSPHAGFSDRICDGGTGQNECPGWGSAEQVIDRCLQQMWNEGPPPSDPCNGQCFQDHGHYINMTNPSHSRVACGFYTTPGGEVWAVQNFSR